MGISLNTDLAFGCIPLRRACIGIGTIKLVFTLLHFLAHPNLQHTSRLIAVIIIIFANASLLYGALQEKKWFVCAWLISAVLFYIGWPIAVLGIIFNTGGFRAVSHFDNIYIILFEYVLVLILYSYCTIVVWSYFCFLRNKDETPANQQAEI